MTTNNENELVSDQELQEMDAQARTCMMNYQRLSDEGQVLKAAELWLNAVRATFAKKVAQESCTPDLVRVGEYALQCGDTVRLALGLCPEAQALYREALAITCTLANQERDLGRCSGEGHAAYAKFLTYLGQCYDREPFQKNARALMAAAHAIMAQRVEADCSEPLEGKAAPPS